MGKDNNILLWIIGGFLAIMLIFGAYFGIGGYGMMGFAMGFGMIFMVIFWGAVTWIVVNLVNQSQSSSRKDEDPMEILKQRYAKGEISKKQYEEMKKDLK